MNIKKYAATVVMAARTHDYFGLANMLGNYLLRLVRLAAMIFIWRGLFALAMRFCPVQSGAGQGAYANGPAAL